MFEAEELPTSVAHLNATLTNVQIDYFSHLTTYFMFLLNCSNGFINKLDQL